MSDTSEPAAATRWLRMLVAVVGVLALLLAADGARAAGALAYDGAPHNAPSRLAAALRRPGDGTTGVAAYRTARAGLPGAAFVVATEGARGLSDLGGVFSSETNAAGGTVWTSTGAISQNDIAPLVNNGMYHGDVNILTGVHGLADGTMVADQSLYTADVARFGNLPSVQVYNLPDLTSAEIAGIMNGQGTTIAGFCDRRVHQPDTRGWSCGHGRDERRSR